MVVNVQGDQPFASAAMLTALVQPYLDGERPPMTTLACPLAPEARDDPNMVKVVCDLGGNALYFSRSLIPLRPAPRCSTSGCTRSRARPCCASPRSSRPPSSARSASSSCARWSTATRSAVCRTERPVIEINTPEDLEAAASMTSGRP